MPKKNRETFEGNASGPPWISRSIWEMLWDRFLLNAIDRPDRGSTFSSYSRFDAIVLWNRQRFLGRARTGCGRLPVGGLILTVVSGEEINRRARASSIKSPRAKIFP